MVDPRHVHLVTTKCVMKYLKGTLDRGLIYAVNGEIKQHGYTNLDLDGSTNERTSTSGCCFSLGSGVISWLGKKKTCVSLNIVEDEYIATFSACS